MHLTFVLIGILFLVTHSYTSECDIIPDDIVKPKNRNEIDRYIIYIQGNPKTYTPNQKYNVSLKVNPNKLPQKAFKQFFLTLDSVEGQSDLQTYGPTGNFAFENNSQIMARISDKCRHTVIENSKMPKWEIQVYWVAPDAGSGCIAIKATVVESRENWFSEDGQLTKILCEDNDTDENIKPPIVDRCCACSEAKYEVAFEGRWTRNTHPRNYPSDVWSTKFSDIIGASHQKYHSFWNEQDYASKGLQDLAETGRTQQIESEIKVMGNNIRTIIKARGLQYPNITDTSYAVFRVDSNNHLVSIVSKITPSPDWFVGVSNFELCKSDCTWAESYTFNLYPMDAGTDDGIGYLSTEPLRFSHKAVMPITQNNPNNPDSPFYDEDGNPMNPIAKLHFTRQRLYEKSCNSNEEPNYGRDEDCATNEWSDWFQCTVPCGLGKKIRVRQYVDPKKARDKCYVKLIDEQPCLGTAKNCRGTHYTSPESSGEGEESQKPDDKDESDKESGDNESEEKKSEEKKSKEKDSEDEKKSEESSKHDNSEEKESKEDNSKENSKDNSGQEEKRSADSTCATGDWSEWSSCSVTCGSGTKTRDRQLIHPENEDKCKDVELQKNDECRGSKQNCDENESKCSNTNWGLWSSCSVSCGVGHKTRLRLPPPEHSRNSKNDENKSDDEEENCSTSETVMCHTDCSGSNFGESLIVEQGADGRVLNCKVSNWSIWSKCEIHTRGATCGKGSKKRSRQILRHPENGGLSCPRKLFQIRSCTIPCSTSDEDDTKSKQTVPEDTRPKCIMSDWTDFTPCSSICGTSAMQLKTRRILSKPVGAVCPPRVEYKPCNLPLACTSDGRPIFL